MPIPNGKNDWVTLFSLSLLSLQRLIPLASPLSQEIVTPTWRALTSVELERAAEELEEEEIEDEIYIRRHLRGELEQESWLKRERRT